jgi:hypothetical protein
VLRQSFVDIVSFNSAAGKNVTGLRKSLKSNAHAAEPNPPGTSQEWLNLEELAQGKSLLKVSNIQSIRHPRTGKVFVDVLANQASRRFDFYLMSQKISTDVATVFGATS